eukprot:1153792-Pelagomonas_calceolata.AAC.4
MKTLRHSPNLKSDILVFPGQFSGPRSHATPSATCPPAAACPIASLLLPAVGHASSHAHADTLLPGSLIGGVALKRKNGMGGIAALEKKDYTSRLHKPGPPQSPQSPQSLWEVVPGPEEDLDHRPGKRRPGPQRCQPHKCHSL